MSIEAMKQMVDALETLNKDGWILADFEDQVYAAIEAGRAAIEQAERNQFNPDWDAMAVMVEEQQRMAKRIKELEQTENQEPVAWRNAAMRVGEDLSSVGPDGYYDMNAEQWLDWAIKQEPRGKTSLPQREWHGLTDEDRQEIERWIEFKEVGGNEPVPAQKIVTYVEFKLREKNSD